MVDKDSSAVPAVARAQIEAYRATAERESAAARREQAEAERIHAQKREIEEKLSKKAWYHDILTVRTLLQTFLGSAATFAALVLFYATVIQPYVDKAEQAEQRVLQAERQMLNIDRQKIDREQQRIEEARLGYEKRLEALSSYYSEARQIISSTIRGMDQVRRNLQEEGLAEDEASRQIGEIQEGLDRLRGLESSTLMLSETIEKERIETSLRRTRWTVADGSELLISGPEWSSWKKLALEPLDFSILLSDDHELMFLPGARDASIFPIDIGEWAIVASDTDDWTVEFKLSDAKIEFSVNGYPPTELKADLAGDQITLVRLTQPNIELRGLQ